MNREILTLQEAKDLGHNTIEYNSTVFKYEDEDGIWHLIREGIEIAKGKIVGYYEPRDYFFEDECGTLHLRKDSIKMDFNHLKKLMENDNEGEENEKANHSGGWGRRSHISF